MSGNTFNYDSVKGYTLDEDAERQLIEAQNECTFMWSTKEGWPVGVIMSYVFHEGCFWLSVSSLRVRVQECAPPAQAHSAAPVPALPLKEEWPPRMAGGSPPRRVV